MLVQNNFVQKNVVPKDFLGGRGINFLALDTPTYLKPSWTKTKLNKSLTLKTKSCLFILTDFLCLASWLLGIATQSHMCIENFKPREQVLVHAHSLKGFVKQAKKKLKLMNKGPFIYDVSHFGGRGGQPNSGICWKGGSVKVWHFADTHWQGGGVYYSKIIIILWMRENMKFMVNTRKKTLKQAGAELCQAQLPTGIWLYHD